MGVFFFFVVFCNVHYSRELIQGKQIIYMCDKVEL